MKNEVFITISIVYYNSDIQLLEEVVSSILKISFEKKVYIIDNSSTLKVESLFKNPSIEYVNVGKNIGYGAGHNLVINKFHINSSYHLILNPDVQFKPSIINKLIEELEQNPVVALIAPKVIYPNGSHQFTCRRYPSVIELISRRLGVLKRIVDKGEYREKDLTEPFFPDFLHGCFLLFKTRDFMNVNGFDERFFLYMEDVDICRKSEKSGKKKLYYSKVEIVHYFNKGSSKKISLFLIHIVSVFKYFYKWKIAYKST
ncbi:MAG: glycosyltransferase family 2 protein [Romboutsia sp.]|nr:glycosyltransferase family 2 protein [Romboutsia sp.]